jgi:hypothetical protein
MLGQNHLDGSVLPDVLRGLSNKLYPAWRLIWAHCPDGAVLARSHTLRLQKVHRVRYSALVVVDSAVNPFSS